MTQVVIPKTSAELEEMLADGDRMKDVLADKQVFAEFTRSYAQAAMEANNAELMKQLKEGLQLGIAEWVKTDRDKNGGIVPLNGTPTALQIGNRHDRRARSSAERSLWNKRAPGIQAEGIFEDAAELFQAGWHARDKYAVRDKAGLAQKLHKLTEVMNSFGSEVPADGGFLIPETLRSELLSIALETAIVRPLATVIPMDSLRVPIPIIDDTSHVSSVFGGITAYWAEESAALTESQASFGRTVLDAKKLTTFANVPNELLQDAPAFQGFFDAKFPLAIAYFEDVAFFTGTGAGEPLGYVNCPASVQVTAEAGQPAGTIVVENLAKMYARMLPTSLGSAVWIASIDCFPQLATMALSVGTGGAPVWMAGGYGEGASAAPPVTIWGRPVIFTEKAPALGTTGDISFVDFSYYLIGDRMQMQSANSPHYRFANDQTSFRIIQRLDGRPWLNSAITPHNNSANTLTPYVQLASR